MKIAIYAYGSYARPKQPESFVNVETVYVGKTAKAVPLAADKFAEKQGFEIEWDISGVDPLPAYPNLEVFQGRIVCSRIAFRGTHNRIEYRELIADDDGGQSWGEQKSYYA
jgi:hypothetical protein